MDLKGEGSFLSNYVGGFPLSSIGFLDYLTLSMLEEAVLQIKMYAVISRFPILDASNSLNIDPLDSTNQNFQFRNHYCNDLCLWPRGDPLTSP